MAGRTKAKEYGIQKRKLPVRVIFTILAVILVIALILFAMSPFLIDSFQAESGAMSPSISISDKIGRAHV